MFTVLFALVISVLMVMLAIVIDLGNLRSMRRDVQAEVDLAALAAGEKLRTFDAVGGCEAAIRYLRINIADLPAGTSVPCNSLPATCNDASTASTDVGDSGTAAPWAIRITYPVADDAIRDPDVPGNGLRTDDGTPCERIGVAVTRSTDGYFSSFVGMESYAANASAVARRTHDQRTRVPSLWLLEPFECEALLVSGSGSNGQAKLLVGSATVGGLVTLDSSGTKNCNSAYTLDVKTNNSSLYLDVFPPTADPPGEITLFALRPGQLTCNQAGGSTTACDQNDIAAGRITPQPKARAARATRSLVDHIYDCLPSYPRYPDSSGITIAPCTAGRAPYITQLRAAVAAGVPPGYQKWSDHGYTCTEPLGMPAAGLAGNWWVDCPSGLSITQSVVNFTGGNVIFTGEVSLSDTGALFVNTANPTATLPAACQAAVDGCLDQSSADAAFVYVNGQLKSTAAKVAGRETVDFRRTSVIQDGGPVSLQGQSPPNWTSPKDGPFRNLSLWSEHGTGYRINGGSSMLLEGIFFTPYAKPFSINGGGDQGALQAQFISRTLDVSGNGSLWLEPAGAGFIHLPPAAAVLIR